MLQRGHARWVKPLWYTLCAAAFLSSNVAAQQPADLFRGKTITINVGFSAGGGYDLHARALARHFGKFVPGNPSVVVSTPADDSLNAPLRVYRGPEGPSTAKKPLPDRATSRELPVSVISPCWKSVHPF